MKKELSSKQVARRSVRSTWFSNLFAKANALLSVVLAIALWTMVNYLGQRHYSREDFGKQQLTQFANDTTEVLEQLTSPVTITLFMTDDYIAIGELTDILTEYEARSDLLEVRRVDPNKDLARADALVREFDLEEKSNTMILQTGKETRLIDLNEMIEVEYVMKPTGRESRMVGFKGEKVLSSTLKSFVRTDRPIIYFVQGHGEKDIDDFERGMDAFSKVREMLESEQYLVRTLDLSESREVPEDCRVLVVAGPRTRIAQPELDVIQDYLVQDGRGMFMIDSSEDTGLDTVLSEFGIQLVDDVVVEQRRNYRSWVDVRAFHPEHPVTKTMGNIQVTFTSPRSVLRVSGWQDAADKPRYTELTASSDVSFANLDPGEDPPEYNQDRGDAVGPIPLAAAVEMGAAGSSGADAGLRLVVVGDSDFAGNALSSGGGLRLIENSIHWLADKEDWLDIETKPVEEFRIQLDKRGFIRLVIWVCVFMPGMVGVLGFFVWLRRKA